jgi:hypothetical protein
MNTIDMFVVMDTVLVVSQRHARRRMQTAQNISESFSGLRELDYDAP